MKRFGKISMIISVPNWTEDSSSLVITDALENHYVGQFPLYISIGHKSDRSKVVFIKME